MAPLRVGSLFSGYDGLGLALESLFPVERAWVSDIKPAAVKLLAHRFPGVPNLGDITKVDWAARREELAVDVITGGFPCTDISSAGKQLGLIRHGADKTRSGLWSEMCEAVNQLRPRLVVAENVRALTSVKADSDVESCPWCVGDEPGVHLRALGAVLADLADIGYDAAWCGLRAADIGFCHGRFRIVILAWPSGADAARLETYGPVAGEASIPGPGRDLPPSADTRGEAVEIWAGFQAGGKAEFRGQRLGNSVGDPEVLIPTPRATDGPKGAASRSASTDKRLAEGRATLAEFPVSALLPTPTATFQSASNRSDSPGAAVRPALGQVASLLPTPSVADATGGHRNRGGDRSGELLLPGLVLDPQFGRYAEAVARQGVVVGRVAPAPTESNTAGGQRLSPRFTEWMMGLPEGWITDIYEPVYKRGFSRIEGLSRSECLSLCGDGVVPQQMAAAVRYLLAAVG